MVRSTWYVVPALFVAPVAAQQRNVEAPRFEVDPLWPKPLPTHWVLGSIGVSVDAQDHVWIRHRPNTVEDNVKAAAGQCFGVHDIAADSQGNLYTTETYTGARVQRFLYRGVGQVPRNQGVPWPRR